MAFAPSLSSRVYALVESRDGVLWRSDDGGTNWKLATKDTMASLDQRPVRSRTLGVSPTDPNTVYGVSMLLATSYDGGSKFNLSAFGVHADLHELWISSNGERMALAGDGGIAISTNRGATWANSRNVPIGQIYRIGVSNETPYLVCGGLQDNNAYCGPAFSGSSYGITNRDWFKVVEGDGEWAVPDPTNPRLVWADSENGEVADLRPCFARYRQRSPLSRNRAGKFRACDVALPVQLGVADRICLLPSSPRVHRCERSLRDARPRAALERDQSRTPTRR